MPSHDNYALTIKTRGGDCSVEFEGVSLLAGSHNNVRKLFRKLVEFAGVVLDYEDLERDLYETEPRGPQGAYNTKNAVRSLRTALFPDDLPDGKQKWNHELKTEKNGIDVILLRLEKPHSSRICLVLPRPADDPDVYVDAELPEEPTRGPRSLITSPFTVPTARCQQFFGRDGFLMDLHDQISSMGSSSIAICGAGGLGKTQIAAEYAHINRDSYPAGVFWIDAKDKESVIDEYALLSRDVETLQTPQDLPVEERARRVRERFHQLREPSLLILDSLVPEASLLELLPATGLCRILATSRMHSLLRSRFQIVNVPDLDIPSSLYAMQSCCTIEQTADRLVAREHGCTYEAALNREKAAVEGICNDLNQRLPLTLTLIAAYVDQRRTTFEECRRRLESDSLKVYERAEVAYSIHAAFNLSRSELSTDAMRVLAAAASFARKNVAPALLREASLIGDSEAFEDAIALLDRSSFIFQDRSGRLTVHDLLRDMTLAQVDSAERNLLLDRTAQSLTSSLSRATELMVWDGVRWEIVQSRAVADTCRLHRRHESLATLLFELGQYYRHQDQTTAALANLDEAARIAAAYVPESRRLLAKCKMQVSAAEPYTRAAIANAKQALAIAREDADYSPAEISEFYNTFGYALKMNGKHWRALPFYCRALQLCESELGRRTAKAAEYLNNISALFEGTGAYKEALEYTTEATHIFLELFGPDHRFYAFSLNTLGRIQRRLGECNKSLDSHSAAREIFLEISGSETKDYAMSVYFEGAALAELGRAEAASACVHKALDILERKYGIEDLTTRRVRLTLDSGVFK